ncbi:MAG: hypothetical protein Kow00121_20760 [Elainellaceae cyanobacterium]
MTQSQNNQPNWWEPVQKFLDSKLVGWGIPGIFIAIAADHAKNSRWQEFGTFTGIAFVAWLVIKIGSRLLPRLDKLLDWIFNNAENWILQIWWNLTSDFKGKYYEGLIDYCRDYRTKGLKTQGDFVLDKEKVFVPLKVAPKSLSQISSGMLIPRTATDRWDIWDFLAKVRKDPTYGRLAIIGSPGSGKTMLLEHLTLTYARNRQQKHQRQAPKLIPVLIYLRNVRDRVTDDQPPTLSALINEQPLVARLQPKPLWFEHRLKQGQCLVMLDGLDEVADEAQRQKVSEWANQQMQTYPTPFIVTSRPVGYHSAPVERVRAILELQPFTFKEVQRFVQDWYLQNEVMSRLGRNTSAVQQEAKQKANDLIKRINDNPPLSDMAVNPLLLTMIATVHRFRGALPGSRLELYAEICDVLLGRRADAKGIATSLAVNQQKAVLQTLSLGLMEQRTYEFAAELGSQLIRDKLAAVAGSEANPSTFLKQVEDLSGLLQQGEQGRYEFVHKSFQEYLAAIEIKDTNRSSLLAINLDDSWWNETIRLYAAQSDATELIQAALTKASIPALTLAYDCVEEGSAVDPDVRQELQNALDTGLESDELERFKLATGVKLSRRLRRFIRIDDTTEIDSSYVTWAEFQRFLDYEQDLSNEFSHAQSLTHQPVAPERFTPGHAHRAVTGISHEDAYRFCTWLGTYFSPKQLGEEVPCYRLPTFEELSQHPCEEDKVLAKSGIRLVRFWIPTRYAQLANDLAAGLWRKADEETLRVMLQVADREEQRYLNLDDIRQFPCQELQKIDQLWVQFSQGRFGFSVQKQIWLEVGGWVESEERRVDTGKSRFFQKIYRYFRRTLRGNEYDKWRQFGERVGWRKQNQWLEYSELSFSESAPPAHLPGWGAVRATVQERRVRGWRAPHGYDCISLLTSKV